MENEEIQSLISQLKAAGLGEEQIMETFYEAFQKGEMDREDLETLANAMGYELTDGFKNEAAPDPINANAEENKAPENLEEQAQEFKENIDDKGEGEKAPEELENPGSTSAEEGEGKEGEKPSEPAPAPSADEEDDDEKGWKEAQEKLKW